MYNKMYIQIRKEKRNEKRLRRYVSIHIRIKKAVRNIISNHEEIFHDAIEYFLMATMNKFM